MLTSFMEQLETAIIIINQGETPLEPALISSGWETKHCVSTQFCLHPSKNVKSKPITRFLVWLFSGIITSTVLRHFTFTNATKSYYTMLESNKLRPSKS